VDVDLDQGLIADALEAVDLPGLDHQDVPGTGFELLPIDDITAAAFPQELDLVVGMAMPTGTAAGQGPEQEHRYVDVALVRTHKLMRAALEREILLTNAIHASVILDWADSSLRSE
jgi:hypothetical protein